LDASGQGVAGKLAGYTHDFGNYDQCVQLESRPDANQPAFFGQYCAISVLSAEYDLLSQHPKLEQSLDRLSLDSKRWVQFNLGHVFGVCIPSTCRPQQLFDLVQSGK
jgi:hypothetical protein